MFLINLGLNIAVDVGASLLYGTANEAINECAKKCTGDKAKTPILNTALGSAKALGWVTSKTANKIWDVSKKRLPKQDAVAFIDRNRSKLTVDNLLQAGTGLVQLGKDLIDLAYDDSLKEKIEGTQKRLNALGKSYSSSSDEFVQFFLNILSNNLEGVDNGINNFKRGFNTFLDSFANEFFASYKEPKAVIEDTLKINLLLIFERLANSLPKNQQGIRQTSIWSPLLYHLTDSINACYPLLREKDSLDAERLERDALNSLTTEQQDQILQLNPEDQEDQLANIKREKQYGEAAKEIYAHFIKKCFPEEEESLVLPVLPLNLVKKKAWDFLNRELEPLFCKFCTLYLDRTRFYRQTEQDKLQLQEELREHPIGEELNQGCHTLASEFVEEMVAALKSQSEIFQALIVEIFPQGIESGQRGRLLKRLEDLVENKKFSVDDLLNCCEITSPSQNGELRKERKEILKLYKKLLDGHIEACAPDTIVNKIFENPNLKSYFSSLFKELLNKNDLGFINFRKLVENHIEIILLQVTKQAAADVKNNFTEITHLLKSFFGQIVSEMEQKKNNNVEGNQNNIIINNNNFNNINIINNIDNDNIIIENRKDELQFENMLVQSLFPIFLPGKNFGELYGLPIQCNEMLASSLAKTFNSLKESAKNFYYPFFEASLLGNDALPDNVIHDGVDELITFMGHLGEKIIPTAAEESGQRVFIQKSIDFLGEAVEYRTIAAFRQIVSHPASIGMINKWLDIRNNPDLADYKEKITATTTGLLIDQAKVYLNPLFSENPQGEAAFKQQLTEIGLSFLTTLIRCFNDAFQSDVEAKQLNLANAQPDNLVVNEEAFNPLDELCHSRINDLLHLKFPKGCETLKEAFPFVVPEKIDLLWDHAGVKLADTLSVMMKSILHQDTLNAVYRVIFEEIECFLDQPLDQIPEPVSEEERAQRRQLGQLLLAQAGFEEFSLVSLNASIPQFLQSTINLNEDKQLYMEEKLGGIVSYLLKGDLLQKCAVAAFSAAAGLERNNEGHVDKLSDRNALHALQKKVIKQAIYYPFKLLEKEIWQMTDVFGETILNDLRLVLLYMAEGLVRGVGLLFQVTKVDNLAASFIHYFMKKGMDIPEHKIEDPQVQESIVNGLFEKLSQLGAPVVQEAPEIEEDLD